MFGFDMVKEVNWVGHELSTGTVPLQITLIMELVAFCKYPLTESVVYLFLLSLFVLRSSQLVVFLLVLWHLALFPSIFTTLALFI